MSDPFVGQIMVAGFGFAPSGYALCIGTTLQVSQNTALFSLIHNSFGGDGRTTFALPDLRGRTFVGAGVGASGTAYPIQPEALAAGKESVALTSQQVPPHAHSLRGASSAGTVGPVGNIFSSVGPASSSSKTYPLYAPPGAADTVVGLANQVSSFGGNGAHENMQPFLVVNFSIATVGTYPPRP